MPRISVRTVDALLCQPKRDRVFLWDDGLTGFGVMALPSGRKSYVVQFRQHGRLRRVKIGDHGRLTPEEARTEAKKMLGDVETGADPVARRKAARAVRTFREVAKEFLEKHMASKRKARSKDDYERLLRLHIFPVIGGTRILDVTRATVAKMHSGMTATPIAANRALSVVSSVWNWAAQRDEVSAHQNPAVGIKRNPERQKERFLTIPELARLGNSLRLAETEGLPWSIDRTKAKAKHAPKERNRRGLIDPHAIAAIRLLILTGGRLREILHAKWQEVDFERGMIHLSDSKTGQKPIYLSAAALQLLSDLPRITGNPYVIPGSKHGAPRADLKKPWARVIEAAELPGLRIHDLRHSFASVGAGGGMGLPIIGKLLGHSQTGTTARYAHLDSDPMRKAVETIGANISAALEGKTSKIVRLKG